jgi:AraC family ethanolamine operon transcriptional activator
VGGDHVRQLGLIKELEIGIPGRLLAALASSRAELKRPSDRMRDAVVERAVSIIEASLADPVSVKELCESAGASWRTLNYAFRERFGVTPKTYMKSVRLNAVCDALRGADPATKVADIANRYGFWHLGQFAADYRKQFGELPSETLTRANGGGVQTG